MDEITRQKFNTFAANVARLNNVAADRVGVPNAGHFSVTPSVQQTLVKRMQESIEFLQSVNILPRDEMVGQKLGLSISQLIARTQKANPANPRTGTDPTSMDGFGYTLRKTNFDTWLGYDTLDTWAKFPEFEQFCRDLIVTAIAQDHIKIGFNGIEWNETSDPVNNPLGQDVNRGWLQAMREENPTRVISTGKAAPGRVTYGAAGDFNNIDELVYKLKQSTLPSWARKAPGLVAIVGDDLIYQKYGAIIAKSEGSLDTIARQVLMGQMTFGDLPGVRVPYFPSDTVMITTLAEADKPLSSNLSIYYQNGKNRRKLWDRPDLDGVSDLQSSNLAFVVEDYTYACMAENITPKEA